jgi:hypothetical protein
VNIAEHHCQDNKADRGAALTLIEKSRFAPLMLHMTSIKVVAPIHGDADFAAHHASTNHPPPPP